MSLHISTCSSILWSYSIRHAVILILIIFVVVTTSVFYVSEPLRSWSVEGTGRNSQKGDTMNSALAGMATSRSSRPTLDIIISMDKENVTEVAVQLGDFIALDPVRDLEVNAVIYVKDPGANLEAIKAETGAHQVIRMSNQIREGGTFLAHIIQNWELLARHTMFVQAGTPPSERIKNRITEYFIPSTGVLPFGQLDQCECFTCKDPGNQEQIFSRLPRFYSTLNGHQCPENITLSHLGQMLVSASRIRSRSRQIYEHLRAILENDMLYFIQDDPRKGWMFQDDFVEPYFAHTIERSWMWLWGCEDVKIIQTCAGDNKRENRDKDDNCQCLD